MVVFASVLFQESNCNQNQFSQERQNFFLYKCLQTRLVSISPAKHTVHVSLCQKDKYIDLVQISHSRNWIIAFPAKLNPEAAVGRFFLYLVFCKDFIKSGSMIHLTSLHSCSGSSPLALMTGFVMIMSRFSSFASAKCNRHFSCKFKCCGHNE